MVPLESFYSKSYIIANLEECSKIEIQLKSSNNTVILYKINKVVFAFVSIREALDIENIIPEEYRPVKISRNFISDYRNSYATLSFSSDGRVTTIGSISSNFAGSFCYITNC